MTVLKKYLFYFFILFIVWIVVGLTYGLYNLFPKNLGNSYAIEEDTSYSTLYSEKLNNFILFDIIDYEYDNKYIITVKIKGSGFTCGDASKKIFEKKIELNVNLELNYKASYINKVLEKGKYKTYDLIVNKCIDVNSYPINKV